jgi:hypothetical protein
MGVHAGGASPSAAWPHAEGGNYFETFGVKQYLGRFLTAPESMAAATFLTSR